LNVVLAKGQETNICAVNDQCQELSQVFSFFFFFLAHFSPHSNIEKWVLFLHFTDEEIEVERNWVCCLISHNYNGIYGI
jgi:hypothetical protein